MLIRVFYFLFFLLPCLVFTYEHEIAICAIFKDEGPYLKEWLEFHKLVGVQHFYLYDHGSTDCYLEALKPYIDKGEVSLYHTNTCQDEHFNRLQCQTYTDTAKNLAGVVKWIAFLDIDEFLFPIEKFYLQDVLKNYEDCIGIGVNWQMFGTSYIEKIPEDKLLIETLVRCAPKNYISNFHVKSISRPEHILFFIDPHTPIYESGLRVNSDKIPFSGAFSPYVQIDTLCINHYWTRDTYYLRNYKIPRREKWGEPAENIWKINEEINQKRNLKIIKYVPFLRKNLWG